MDVYYVGSSCCRFYRFRVCTDWVFFGGMLLLCSLYRVQVGAPLKFGARNTHCKTAVKTIIPKAYKVKGRRPETRVKCKYNPHRSGGPLTVNVAGGETSCSIITGDK